MTTAPRVWLITGASRGLGRAFGEAGARRGRPASRRSRARRCRWVATHWAIAADVTDRAAVFAAVEQAVAHFGRLDVVVGDAAAIARIAARRSAGR